MMTHRRLNSGDAAEFTEVNAAEMDLLKLLAPDMRSTESEHTMLRRLLNSKSRRS